VTRIKSGFYCPDECDCNINSTRDAERRRTNWMPDDKNYIPRIIETWKADLFQGTAYGAMEIRFFFVPFNSSETRISAIFRQSITNELISMLKAIFIEGKFVAVAYTTRRVFNINYTT